MRRRMLTWIRQAVIKAKRKWWVGALLILGKLVEDRVLGWTNAWLDSRGGIAERGIKIGIAWLATNPLGVTGVIFLTVILFLIVHAYLETKGPQLASGQYDPDKPRVVQPITADIQKQLDETFVAGLLVGGKRVPLDSINNVRVEKKKNGEMLVRYDER